MEKKARVQRLSRQDDVKRSWAEAFQDLEEVVEALPEEKDERAENMSEEPRLLPEPPPKSPNSGGL
jgi:hypothetical protein